MPWGFWLPVGSFGLRAFSSVSDTIRVAIAFFSSTICTQKIPYYITGTLLNTFRGEPFDFVDVGK